MKFRIRSIMCLLILSVIFTCTACLSQQAKQHDKKNHDGHHAEVNERGDNAMGFSHRKTTHRFRLLTNGGAIEVRANNADDKESVEQIRKHLRHISQVFPAGNFEAPFLTHGKTPPGVPVMQRLTKEINYEYEEAESGARVRLSTKNAEALAAIHDFMKFQIEDHQTGNSMEIEKP
ncbi:MAG TPA: hypothetical protein VEQ34_05460 [Pyrinomonadaceae bacterium]|nr:hypothetical protein [Pyrinomonadaceae bacterium]